MMSNIKAPITANAALAAVGAIFTWGVREELVAANPCKLVAGNPTRARERTLSDGELPLFWNALDGVDKVTAAALRIVLLTGQRPGEVAHMRKEHIKDGTWWEMPGQPMPELGWPGTKNARSHRVPLSEAVQTIIAQVGITNGFVFGRAITGLDRAMRAVCGNLEIERATPHDLRRTFASKVTALGHGRTAMDRLLNHSDHSVGSIYDRHGYQNEDRKIMEAVARHIMGIVEGRDASGTVIRGRF
jgi:integrase